MVKTYPMQVAKGIITRFWRKPTRYKSKIQRATL